MKIQPLNPFVAAEVTEIDLTQPLSADAVGTLTDAHARHGVLVFPGQRISSEDLLRIGRSFGELTIHPFSTNSAEVPELIHRIVDGR